MTVEFTNQNDSEKISQRVCFEVCLEYRGATITPTREEIRESIEFNIKMKRKLLIIPVDMDLNIDALIEKVNTKIAELMVFDHYKR